MTSRASSWRPAWRAAAFLSRRSFLPASSAAPKAARVSGFSRSSRVVCGASGGGLAFVVVAAGGRVGGHRLQLDHLAERQAALGDGVPPGGQRAEGHRALAERRQHGVAPGLDALGDRDLAFAGQQRGVAHLAEEDADRVVGAAEKGGVDRGGAGPVVLFLDAGDGGGGVGHLVIGGLVALGLDHVDAELLQHGGALVDVFLGDLAGRQRGLEFVAGHPPAGATSRQQLREGRPAHLQRERFRVPDTIGASIREHAIHPPTRSRCLGPAPDAHPPRRDGEKPASAGLPDPSGEGGRRAGRAVPT